MKELNDSSTLLFGVVLGITNLSFDPSSMGHVRSCVSHQGTLCKS